ncbi:MAG: 16S rRNA (cytidine(1402)-2'-O)-methyltransferase [Paracoccaceae bacterium]|nr:16S rRNA (cytidine(1402)-2'-O)-methyltransferase [Paracoccaceae bacterium]
MGDAAGRTPPKPTAALYIVATPIGNARDITLRALDILGAADVIAAEDTRSARRLMEIHGVALADRPILAYHDHNGPAVRPRLLAALSEGRSVAYVSDAGTPMVADPGFVLAREAIAAGHRVEAVPGASAVLAALTVSGLPTDRFLFAGFAPAQAGARRRFLEGLRDIEATLVIYETPRRLKSFLKDAVAVLGPDRQAAVCRELTKRFEEVRRMPLQDLLGGVEEMVAKGECVVVVDRAEAAGRPRDPAEIGRHLAAALQRASFKDAVRDVSESLGIPRREVYQIGLRMQGHADEEN